MKHRRFAIGPGAASLILVIVALCMTTLGVLSLRSAQNDVQLSRRSIQVAQEVNQLNASAEHTLMLLDSILAQCAEKASDQNEYQAMIAAQLPQGMMLEDGCIRWLEMGEGRALACAAAVSPLGQKPALRWAAHELQINEEMGLDDEWN